MGNTLTLDSWQLTSILVPFIVLVLCPAVVLTIVARMRRHKIDKKAEVMIAAIQNGVELNDDFFDKTSGKTGCSEKKAGKFQEGVTATVIGVVFIIIGFCVMRRINLFSLLFFIPGGFSLARGIGQVASFLVSKKNSEKKSETSEEGTPDRQ